MLDSSSAGGNSAGASQQISETLFIRTFKPGSIFSFVKQQLTRSCCLQLKKNHESFARLSLACCGPQESTVYEEGQSQCNITLWVLVTKADAWLQEQLRLVKAEDFLFGCWWFGTGAEQ